MTLSLVAEVTRQICVVEGYIAGAAKVKSFSNTDNSKLQLKIALVASIFLLKNLIKIQSLNFFLKMYQCKCALHMYLFPIINNRCKMAYVQCLTAQISNPNIKLLYWFIYRKYR